MQFCKLDGYVIGQYGGQCRMCGDVLCNLHWHAPLPEYPTVRQNRAYTAAAEAPKGAVCTSCRDKLGRQAVAALPPVVVPTDPLMLLAFGRTDPDARLADLLPRDLRPMMRKLVPFAREQMRPTAHKRGPRNFPEIFDAPSIHLSGLLMSADYREYKRTGLYNYDVETTIGVGPYYYEVAGVDGLMYSCTQQWKGVWKIESRRPPTQSDVFAAMKWINPEVWPRLLNR